MSAGGSAVESAQPSGRNRPSFWPRLVIDALLTTAIVVLLSFRLTGLAIHEWLGIASLAVLMAHMVTNWRWLAITLRKFVGPLPRKTRLNLVLTIALLVVVIGAILSGVIISRIAMPAVNIEVPAPASDYGGPRSGRFWSEVHIYCTNIILVLLGTHLALNWAWVAATVNTRILRPLLRHGRGAAAQ